MLTCMTDEAPAAPEMLTPAEVAQLFRVNPKTVVRWAKQGKLRAAWTPGGQRRYYADEVHVLLRQAREWSPAPEAQLLGAWVLGAATPPPASPLPSSPLRPVSQRFAMRKRWTEKTPRKTRDTTRAP